MIFVDMKSVLCLVALISLGTKASDIYWLGHVNGYDVNPGRQQFFYPEQSYQEYAHRDHQHPQVHIERPCHTYDINCIRHFLAHHSKCTPVYGPSQDPYIIKKGPMDLPHSNVSLTLYNAQLKGLNTAKVKTFYINKKTDTLVLEVVFDKLEINSPKTVAFYRRRGREPIQNSDYTIIVFNDLSLTLTVQGARHIDLKNGHVYTYISEKNPLLKVGPGHLDIKGKGLTHLDLKWIYDLDLSVMEGFVAVGPPVMAAYLQNTICDFGAN